MAERIHWWTERWECLSICLSVCLSVCLSAYLSVFVSICLSIYPSIYLSFHLSVYLSAHQSTYGSTYLSVYLPVDLSICLSIYLSVYLSISICLSIYLSVCLSICLCSRRLSIYLSIYLSICLPASLKTKLFCETSSTFEIDNIKNEAILRDVLQKWKVECGADGLVPMRFAIFPLHLSKVLRLPRKSDAKSYKVLQLSRKINQNHLSKPEDLMLQNATPLRKSAPCPPNISDEHVSCTAPATENASLQILFKCPTPAIVLGNATKSSRFAGFWQGAQSLAPATRSGIWTSKSGPIMWCF